MEVTAVDIKNVCRACLLPSNELQSIIGTFFNEESLESILLIVGKINVKFDDKYSTLICAECKQLAINSFRFQQMCIESERNLKLLVENLGFEQEILGKEEDITTAGSSLAQELLIEKDKTNEDFQFDDLNDQIIYEAGDTSESEDQDNDEEEEEEHLAEEISSDEESDKAELIYSCSQCPKLFKSSEKLNSHLENHEKPSKGDVAESDSSEDTKFPCKDCGRVYKRRALLLRHKKAAHSGQRRVEVCMQCDKKFSSSAGLTRHEIIHSDLVERSKLTRLDSQEFICIICEFTFPTPEAMSSHVKTHKSKAKEDQDYNCKLCHNSFPSLTDIIKHSKNHIENATHQCTICNKLLSMGDELIDHFLRHKGMKPHECPICKKSFLKLHKLNVHIRTHSEDKPYLCPECGKSLSTNENLKRHLIRHSGIKPYACNLCPSRFVFKSGLTSHMSTHTGLKPFVCAICGSSFTKSSSLTKHHRIHTGERPYVCEVCGMRFNSSDHVKRHMRTHTGERPYKCQYCDRSYAQSNDLLKHTRVHVGENTYKCNLCSSAFRLQAQLREHYRIHYDISTLRTSDMIDTKPQIIAEMDIIDQERRCQEQIQFVNNIIKSESLESEIYENLSSNKKQKLN